MGELYNMVGVCVMDTGYMGAAVWCDFTEKLYGRAEHPDCRMLGGMRSFRAVKVAFEKWWFANLFGAGQTISMKGEPDGAVAVDDEPARSIVGC
jgi:hypothetical protein